jgi:putative hemolysin
MRAFPLTPRVPDFPVLPLLPQPLRSWASPIAPVLEKILIPDGVKAHVAAARENGSGARFASSLLASLGIQFEVEDRDLERIPASGAAVVVANHPYGIVEGLILMAMVDRIRRDMKILANSVLAGVSEVTPHTILVNPFHAAAHPENHGPVRDAVSWLSRGGLLSIFPAGEVAHTDWNTHAVVDPPWKTTAVRLATRAKCVTLPIFFEGSNSIGFQLAGVLHPALRTASLPREFYRLRGTTIRLRIGHPIPHSVLSEYSNPDQATDYLRARTYFLGHRSEPALTQPSAPALRVRNVAPPGSPRLLSEEVDALPAECQIAGNREFAVYLASAYQIPALLAEIGRGREITFRAAGEGTGEEADLDRFDDSYRHLFLWSRQDSRLAGSYRLAFTADILPRHGISGLYTSTLFRYDAQFFEQLGPAVELGRSFILPEYQRRYSPLLLLWKGILTAVARRSGVRKLFGAVSISRDYRDASRLLIADYLTRTVSHPLANLVTPRRPFRCPPAKSGIHRMCRAAAGLDDISSAIADIERDSKGVPVLVRQYLKAGGRLLGLNLDRRFADAVDALLVMNLEQSSSRVVERCLVRQ